MVEQFDTRQMMLDLFREPTERDKQVSIGASNASNPCTRCLADDLLGIPQQQSGAFMGAVIGTAIHNLLEKRVEKMHSEWMPEQRVSIGYLEGYGEVKSTTDLYIPSEQLAHDHKSTTKVKLVQIKEALTTEATEYDTSKVAEARFKTQWYLAQLHLYGLGIERAGHVVQWLSLGFVCRDAVGASDVWAHVVPYDREHADRVWGRLERLWSALQGGLDPTGLTSHPNCWYCQNVRDREDR